MIISDKILYLRKKLGLTQEELAELLDVSRQSISKWESAQSIPDITKIMAMAKVFSVSTDYLLMDEIETLNGDIKVDISKHKKVSIEQAYEFINAYAMYSKRMAKAVLFFILAAISIILALDVLKENYFIIIAIIISFVFAIIGINYLILSKHSIENYKYILNREFELSNNVCGIIKEAKSKYNNYLLPNISVIILAGIPLVISGVLSESNEIHVLMFCLFALLSSVPLANLIARYGKKKSYDLVLLDIYAKSYDQKSQKIDIIEDFYWGIAVAIFLVWGMLFDSYHIAWIVFPVAALLSVVFDYFRVDSKE